MRAPKTGAKQAGETANDEENEDNTACESEEDGR